MPWTRTADALPEPNVWLMGTVPGREYPMLVRLKADGDEPCWETRTGDTTPLRACSHWDYFEPLEDSDSSGSDVAQACSAKSHGTDPVRLAAESAPLDSGLPQ